MQCASLRSRVTWQYFTAPQTGHGFFLVARSKPTWSRGSDRLRFSLDCFISFVVIGCIQNPSHFSGKEDCGFRSQAGVNRQPLQSALPAASVLICRYGETRPFDALRLSRRPLEAILPHLFDPARHVVSDLTENLRHAVILGRLHSGGAHRLDGALAFPELHVSRLVHT